MRIWRVAAIGWALAVCSGGGAGAQPPGPAQHWRALTTADLEAAYALVRDNHPAAVPELGDAAFRTALKSGYEAARARAARADSLDAYAAVMAGFAYSLGDKHIWSHTLYRPVLAQWPGFIVAKRGASWTVVDEDPAEGVASLKGARLLACDGIPVETMAARTLGVYRAVWSVEAQRISASPWLLANDGNPFVTPPKTCEFEQGGARRSVTLTWTVTGRAALGSRLARATPVGAAGHAVRRFPGGWWIGVESLSDAALPVIEQVKANAAAIRAAPLVVVDVRGNSGGDSRIGRSLAEALVGSPVRLGGRAGAGVTGCGEVWRASPGAIATLERYIPTVGARGGPNVEEGYRRQLSDLKAAAATGRPFAIDVARCTAALAGEQAAVGSASPTFGSVLKGRVILLTDRVCFSSCLLMTDDFRRLGALHVGEATDAATRYMEVREEKLPSGLSMFSTLQKASLTSPAQIGPYAPAHVFEGDISDTAALEAWVTESFGPR